MKLTKAERHEMIRERARNAIRDMYHNATPVWPAGDCDGFFSWMQGEAESELEYLNGGGAYGTDYARTLRATCNAGRYSSHAACDYYVRKETRSMRLDRDKYAQWEAMPETYGQIYSWGRGGRTLAPECMIKRYGGSSFSMREDLPDEMPIARVMQLIQIVESFNAYVRAWCESLPEQWADYVAELEFVRLAEECERAEMAARGIVTEG